MDDKVKRRVEEIQTSEIFKRVKEIQASMVESAKSYFDDSEHPLGSRLFLGSSTTYRRSVGATDSKVNWGMVSSKESFKTQFVSMFNQFSKEVSFERKCRASAGPVQITDGLCRHLL